MSGIPHPEFLQLAREVEDAGFSGVFIPEANNDALMCSYAVVNGDASCQNADMEANGVDAQADYQGFKKRFVVGS